MNAVLEKLKIDPTIGISSHDIDEVVKFLNNLLSNECEIYRKTRNAHWNMNGENILELHHKLEIQYEDLNMTVEDIAGQVRTMGHFAEGSLKDFVNDKSLVKENCNFNNPRGILNSLISDHQTIISTIKQNIGLISIKYNNHVTATFVSDIMVRHEKMVVVLQKYLV